MKTIQRTHYLNKISHYIDKDIIKVLIGNRRVGKTTILVQLSKRIAKENSNANIIFINKEFYQFKDIQSNDDLYNYVIQKTKKVKRTTFLLMKCKKLINLKLH